MPSHVPTADGSIAVTVFVGRPSNVSSVRHVPAPESTLTPRSAVPNHAAPVASIAIARTAFETRPSFDFAKRVKRSAVGS